MGMSHAIGIEPIDPQETPAMIFGEHWILNKHKSCLFGERRVILGLALLAMIMATSKVWPRNNNVVDIAINGNNNMISVRIVDRLLVLLRDLMFNCKL